MNSDNEIDRCAGCLFSFMTMSTWEPHTDGVEILRCRRFPPTILQKVDEANFPKVGENYWCGEFKPGPPRL